MGTDTKGLINKNVTILDIQRLLENKFGITDSKFNSSDDRFYSLVFTFEEENRMLSVYLNSFEKDFNEDFTWLSLGAYGCSIKIIKGIVENYGGFIKEYDSRDDWDRVEQINEVKPTEIQILENSLYRKLVEQEYSIFEKQRIVNYVRDNLEFIKSL